MATAERNDKPELPPKKATREGYYTIEPRPFNWGELAMVMNIVSEFKADQAWLEEKRTTGGKKQLVVYTDTPERAAFIDWLLNRENLVGHQDYFEKLAEKKSISHPLRESLCAEPLEHRVIEIDLDKLRRARNCTRSAPFASPHDSESSNT